MLANAGDDLMRNAVSHRSLGCFRSLCFLMCRRSIDIRSDATRALLASHFASGGRPFQEWGVGPGRRLQACSVAIAAMSGSDFEFAPAPAPGVLAGVGQRANDDKFPALGFALVADEIVGFFLVDSVHHGFRAGGYAVKEHAAVVASWLASTRTNCSSQDFVTWRVMFSHDSLPPLKFQGDGRDRIWRPNAEERQELMQCGNGIMPTVVAAALGCENIKGFVSNVKIWHLPCERT